MTAARTGTNITQQLLRLTRGHPTSWVDLARHQHGPTPAVSARRYPQPHFEKAKPMATPAEGIATERTRRHTDPPAPEDTMWTPDRMDPKAHLPAPDGTMSDNLTECTRRRTWGSVGNKEEVLLGVVGPGACSTKKSYRKSVSGLSAKYKNTSAHVYIIKFCTCTAGRHTV